MGASRKEAQHAAHFTTYKTATQDMVRSLRLIDAASVLLRAKG